MDFFYFLKLYVRLNGCQCFGWLEAKQRYGGGEEGKKCLTDRGGEEKKVWTKISHFFLIFSLIQQVLFGCNACNRIFRIRTKL